MQHFAKAKAFVFILECDVHCAAVGVLKTLSKARTSALPRQMIIVIWSIVTSHTE